MPISSFGSGLQKVISFLPGTYGTALVRNHALGGVFAEMKNLQIPTDVITSMKDGIDCNVYFFGYAVSVPAMYIILTVTVVLLVGVYVLINALKNKDK